MRTLPKTIGETFMQYDKANNKIIGIKKIAEEKYETVEKEVGKRDKQEAIEEVKAQLTIAA